MLVLLVKGFWELVSVLMVRSERKKLPILSNGSKYTHAPRPKIVVKSALKTSRVKATVRLWW